ncbi:MAG: FecR domain-containing protein [Carboxylicivirga sp.]|jgi:ferric-dicitrate binding protein FerR (iron transport regulator)|nr:FecR domain-containing protein [Carboxylicivirga sp.]
MEHFYEKDNFLARWMNNTLSEEEIKAFEASEDYQLFNAIKEGSSFLRAPNFDKEQAFARVLDKQKQLKLKNIRLLKYWSYAAASVAAIFLLVVALNNTSTYSTNFGEQLAFNLPDNSEVVLNSKSKLTFSNDTWNTERKIELVGEAFFKVEKGKVFTVLTPSGAIRVLGTRFTAHSSASVLEVVCYEGKVKVSGKHKSRIIGAGEGLRIVNNSFERWETPQTEPLWLKGESRFFDSPLELVISSLEKQYNIKINSDKLTLNKLRYSGSFSNNDLNLALRVVFKPLGINYTFEGKKTIILDQ